jgi:hypothetical protein
MPRPYCICTEGFTGNTCESVVVASDADDTDTPADTIDNDEATPADTAVSDEAVPTDTTVSDQVGPADVPSPDVPAPPAFMEACNAWNAALAERKVVCLKANPDYLAGRPDALDCTTLKADIDAGLTTYDATNANACTADLQVLPCSGLVSTTSTGPFEFPVPGSDCEGVLVGTGVSTVGPTTGTECRRSTQCASGYCTTRTLPGQCPGICEDRLADGVECAFPPQCAAGLTCGSGTCKAAGTTGSSCYVDDRCAPDLRCLNGSCQAPLANGQSCTYDLQCTPGHRCFGGTCQPLVGLGATCVEAATLSLPTVCGDGYWCNAGTCAAYPIVEQSCVATPGCTGGYCDYTNNSGTCTAYLAIGDTCTSKSQCASQVAASNTCVAYGDFYCGTQF